MQSWTSVSSITSSHPWKKNWLGSTDIPLFQKEKKKKTPHFFHLEIQADLEVFPTHYPYHSLFLNADEE